VVLPTPGPAPSITIGNAADAHQEISAGGAASTCRYRRTSFVASTKARSTPVKPNASTKPFFDERAIEGFFNEIDPKATFKIGPVNEREARESGLCLEGVFFS
jgi:hypothetical protein